MSINRRIPLALLTSAIDRILSRIAFPNRHLALLEKVTMPQEHKEAARKSFGRAKTLDKVIQPRKLDAWRVLIPVLKNLPREAEHLPPGFEAYDNERSINGDQYPWILDPATGAISIAKAPMEDTPETRAACYYAPGCDPRGPEARYVWLGQRNRASRLAFELGPEAIRDDTEFWGDPATNNGHEGTIVRRMGEHYEIYSCKRWLGLCIRTRYGFKIGNVLAHGVTRAMVVTIPFSLQRWEAKQ